MGQSQSTEAGNDNSENLIDPSPRRSKKQNFGFVQKPTLHYPVPMRSDEINDMYE
jgi:hypothetical protein